MKKFWLYVTAIALLLHGNGNAIEEEIIPVVIAIPIINDSQSIQKEKEVYDDKDSQGIEIQERSEEIIETKLDRIILENLSYFPLSLDDRQSVLRNIKKYAETLSEDLIFDYIRFTAPLLRPWMNKEAIIETFLFWQHIDCCYMLISQEIYPFIDMIYQGNHSFFEYKHGLCSECLPIHHKTCDFSSANVIDFVRKLISLGKNYNDECKEEMLGMASGKFMESRPIGLSKARKNLGHNSLERIQKAFSFYRGIHSSKISPAVIPSIISTLYEEGVRIDTRLVETQIKRFVEARVIAPEKISLVLKNFLRMDRIKYKATDFNCNFCLREPRNIFGQAQGAYVFFIEKAFQENIPLESWRGPILYQGSVKKELFK